jgi:hypothetical protein
LSNLFAIKARRRRSTNGPADEELALDPYWGEVVLCLRQNIEEPLTSSSSLRAEDSFCKTAMSRREDNVSCIDVTIMDRSAHSALPSSYSKIFPAFGAGAAVTHAAGLGGKRFNDLVKPSTSASRLRFYPAVLP